MFVIDMKQNVVFNLFNEFSKQLLVLESVNHTGYFSASILDISSSAVCALKYALDEKITINDLYSAIPYQKELGHITSRDFIEDGAVALRNLTKNSPLLKEDI